MTELTVNIDGEVTFDPFEVGAIDNEDELPDYRTELEMQWESILLGELPEDDDFNVDLNVDVE